MAGVRIDRHVSVTMRDGVQLVADVWRPERNEPHPVLLQRTPYGRDGSYISLWQSRVEPLAAIDQGFAVVIQDVRGTGGSSGVFRPFHQEADDGEDTINWLTSQPWCNGKICGYGGSYVGATQLLAATRNPGGLVGMITRITAAEYWEGWSYQGGAPQLGFLVTWSATVLAERELARRAGQGADTSELRSRLDDFQGQLDRNFAAVEAGEVTVLDELVPELRTWLDHSTRDQFWQATSIAGRYEQISAPALHVGGWHDIFLAGTLANFTALHRQDNRNRLIVGPWAHGNSSSYVGDIPSPPLANEDSFDIQRRQLDYAKACVNDQKPPGPAVLYYLQGDERWCSADQWPPENLTPVTYYLTGHSDSSEFGGLGTSAPQSEDTAEFLYDPNNPAPTVGGNTFLPGLSQGYNVGPKRQSDIETRDDILTFTSAPLEHGVNIIGNVDATLWVQTDSIDTDWTVRLCKIDLDGTSIGIVDGILRARFEQDPSGRNNVPAGDIVPRTIHLGATAIALAGGERIRVQISASNYPRFARNPAVWAQGGPKHTRGIRHRVLFGPAHPSSIAMNQATVQ